MRKINIPLPKNALSTIGFLPILSPITPHKGENIKSAKLPAKLTSPPQNAAS